jgi:hypothetical protein
MWCLGWMRISACAAALILLRVAFAQADFECPTPEQRAAQLAALEIGAKLRYGDSVDELALYRLIRGIDQDLLPNEIRDIPWGGPDVPIADSPDDQEAQFRILLTPESILHGSAEAVSAYQGAELFLQDSGLYSYRPEYGFADYPADWWLDGAQNRVYQTMDIAEWLQTMAASDTFHRVYRGYGKRSYRTLRTSWTYFDPWQWDKRAYTRVTDRALEKWRSNGDLLWLAAAFSRITTRDPAEAELLGYFDALHARVKSCGAGREELLIYPLFRFHALRLLIQAGIEERDGSFDRALALLRDPVLPKPVRNDTTSDYAVGDRAAHLMAARLHEFGTLGEYRQVVVGGRAEPLPYGEEGTYVDAFIDMSWAFANSYSEYLTLSKNRSPGIEEVLILNGLSARALWALAQSDAFTPEFRLAAAQSAWLRAFLLGQTKLADEILKAVGNHLPALSDMAPAILAAQGAEKERLTLLVLLRHPDITIQVRNDFGAGRSIRWCGDLSPAIYKATLEDLFGPVLRMDTIPISEQWYRINYREGLMSASDTTPDYAARSPAKWRTTTPMWLHWGWGYWDPMENPIDMAELQRLSEVPAAPTYLMQRAIAWAEQAQSRFDPLRAWVGMEIDQRPAEALHLAIRSAKSGCDEREGPLSRQAWIRLHDNPRWKAWADKTPYWYD